MAEHPADDPERAPAGDAIGEAQEGGAGGPGLAQTGHVARTQGPRKGGAKGEKAEKAPKTAKAEPPPEPEPELPKDAYVVSLPAFEGPLDLLLQIIQKHELDILDIPIGFITEKYLAYLGLMREMSIDVASEYLVMAATLALIKSKMLLPDVGKDGALGEGEEEEEEDPRAELVRRLLEYQKYKAAAEALQSRDTLGSAVFPRGMTEEAPEGPAPFARFGVVNLLDAFAKVLGRTNTKIEHEVIFDRISISDRIVELTDLLRSRRNLPFEEIFSREGRSPSRFDLIITFLAVLEMCRLRMMRVLQTESLSPIHVELVVVTEEGDDPLGMQASAPPPAPAPEPDAEREPGPEPDAALQAAAAAAASEVEPVEAEAASEPDASEAASEAASEIAPVEAAAASEPEASEVVPVEAEAASEPEASEVAPVEAEAASEPEASEPEASEPEASEVAPIEVEAASEPEASEVAPIEVEAAREPEASEVAPIEVEAAREPEASETANADEPVEAEAASEPEASETASADEPVEAEAASEPEASETAAAASGPDAPPTDEEGAASVAGVAVDDEDREHDDE